MMVEEAAAFARRAHEGVFRKGSKVPYIVHPLETAMIVAGFTDDEEMIAAALLHDVVEDAGVTPQKLEEMFGTRVMELVLQETEDKSKGWHERKAHTLKHLAAASTEVKILALGDKLSNMRSTARDYIALGDEVWQRFRVKEKKWHAWYYLGLAESLKELSYHFYYQEYVTLCHQVFGKERPDRSELEQ